MRADSIFPVDSSNKHGESNESLNQRLRPVFSHMVTPISEAQRICYSENGAMCSTEGHGSLTLHKLEASLHRGLHLPSTTENKLSAGVSKRKWEGFRARPPATVPHTRSQSKVLIKILSPFFQITSLRLCVKTFYGVILACDLKVVSF